ncbi:hypothetical protein Tco_1501950 [Tanacetum coccineum]
MTRATTSKCLVISCTTAGKVAAPRIATHPEPFQATHACETVGLLPLLLPQGGGGEGWWFRVLQYEIYGVCIGILAYRGLSLVSSPLHAMKSPSQIQSSAAVKFRVVPTNKFSAEGVQAGHPMYGTRKCNSICGLFQVGDIRCRWETSSGHLDHLEREVDHHHRHSFLDAITFSNGKPASETSELNPEDVTARLEDLEVEIDTLHADTEDKELLISELQDSLASAENEIAIL